MKNTSLQKRRFLWFTITIFRVLCIRKQAIMLFHSSCDSVAFWNDENVTFWLCILLSSHLRTHLLLTFTDRWRWHVSKSLFNTICVKKSNCANKFYWEKANFARFFLLLKVTLKCEASKASWRKPLPVASWMEDGFNRERAWCQNWGQSRKVGLFSLSREPGRRKMRYETPSFDTFKILLSQFAWEVNFSPKDVK